MSLEARATRALRELSRVAEGLAERAELELPTALELTVSLSPTEDWRGRGKTAVDALRQALERTRPPELVWRDGALWCFQCRANDCRHATPREPIHVFRGYAPTGKPEWRPFVDLCLERHIQGVDRLFGSRPGVVAVEQRAPELTGELLPGFGQGSEIYNVLGQVVAGLVPADLHPGSERVAVSLQVVEIRRAQGSGPRLPELRLNVIGLAREALTLAATEGAPRSRAERLRRTLQQARKRLGSLGRRAALAETRREPFDLTEAVGPILSRLRSDLERVFRQREDRTEHARTRHAGAERPTGKAWDDARHVSPDGLLRDTRRGTIVVIGPKSRAHVFSEDGRHVTSLRLEPGELDRKRGQGRWRPLSQADQASFRVALQALDPKERS